MLQAIERLRSRAHTPIDSAWLAAFRVLFGVVLCAGIVRFLFTGWIELQYEQPRWFFSFPGCSWVRPWPAPGMLLHYSALAFLALGIALGLRTRVCLMLFLIGFAYTQLIDLTNYLNHHYLVLLLGVLLLVLPSHQTWSLDARAGRVRSRSHVPAWMLWLVRFQVGVVYMFAGLAKAKADWLFHGQPLGLWLAARTELPVVGPWFSEPATALVMSWAGFLFDTTIVLWLSWRRTRLWAYGAVLGFHGMTGWLFNIGMFPIIMSSVALVFFSPSWPRRALGWLLPAIARAPEPTAVQPPARPRWQRTALALMLVAHVLTQLALPLRHLLYPGDVLWNERGMRFAWHVMLREKHGSVTFEARLEGGRRLEVPPHNYLTPRQEREMSSQPDLIAQLARKIGQDLEAHGHHGVQVHARAKVSLNGRVPLELVDPEVDLYHADPADPRWILPGPSGPPPAVIPVR